jgi:hypothetical protein
VKNIFYFLSICFLALACGGGGGGGSSSSGTTSFKVADADAETFSGTWYAHSFALDGDQTIPSTVRQVSYTFSSDGTWTALLAADYGGGVVVDALNSENSSADFTTTSFSYVIESENKVTLSTAYTDSTGPHTVSSTLIKSGVDETISGTYDLDINSYRANGTNLLTANGYTANYFTINTNGEMSSTLVDSGNNESTSVTNIVIRSGSVSNSYSIYLIDGSYQNNGVGSLTLVGSIITVSFTYANGTTVQYSATKR